MHRSIPQNLLNLNLGQQIDQEPLFSATDPVVELGEALECYLFGGTLHFLGTPYDGSLEASGGLGLAWVPWVPPGPAMTENSLQQDAEPLIWAVSARSVGRMFGLDTSTVTIARPVSIELTPTRAVSITVEACAGDLYETLFQARLLTMRKGISVWQNGQERGKSNKSHIHRSRSPHSGRLASP
jgi:hypothetical protein